MHHQKNMNIHSHILVQMALDHQHLSFQKIYIRYLPIHKYKVWLHDMNLLCKYFMMIIV